MVFAIPFPFIAAADVRFRALVSSYERGLLMLMSALKELTMALGDCPLQATEEACSKRKKSSGSKPGKVINLLDPVLKDNLDRLKMIKDLSFGFSDAEEAVIRYLCLGRKVGPALWLRNKFLKENHIPNVSTHNHLIYELCRNGYLKKADLLIKEMQDIGCIPNVFTYNTFIKGCCSKNDFSEALRIFSSMKGHGIRPNRHTRNILLHALCKKNLLTDARVLQLKILNVNCVKESSDRVTSTILIETLFREGYVLGALDLWTQMLQDCNQVDVVAYNVLIRGFCLIEEVRVAYNYLGDMFKKGILPDIVTYNTLISYFCKKGRFDEAWYILGAMPSMGVAPDLISYKLMILSFCMRGDVTTAHKLLNHMLKNSVIPSTHIWNVIIDSYGQSGDLVGALSIRDQMKSLGVLPNIYTYSAVIYALSKGGDLGAAVSVKEEMMQRGICPNIFTYNILIGAACCRGFLELALQLYAQMLRRCCPNIITYTELIKGHCMRGQLKEAEEVFWYLWKSGLEVDHFPYQVLIEHYCKNGVPQRVVGLCKKLLTDDP